ncbi:MarR family winged helix-turn-helix transcriptional regulator [Balneatrix alpica]|uniref:MarR family winged helix-turn-helix transcriptional regulator n=1 Tax=Balneatrix alpica TaxID=75684 RepID=A0ABV5Z7G1_9GAMM|nr:MarR family transcriptional regulator [Balneatrix alpica]
MPQDHIDTMLAQWRCQRPELDPTPIELIARVARIYIHLDKALRDLHASFQLGVGEFDVLATLRRSGAPFQLTPTALFKSALLTSGAMTNRLDRLEKAGLIARSPDPADRRSTLVSLTEAGLERIDRAIEAHLELEQQLQAHFAPAERDQLAALLRTWVCALEPEQA